MAYTSPKGKKNFIRGGDSKDAVVRIVVTALLNLT